MKNFTLRNRNRGVALLEVLIAAVVLAGGLVALAKFQGDMLQSSSNSKARSTAAKLAQEKIDDLRSFDTLDDDAVVGVFGYSDITGTGVDGEISTGGTHTAGLDTLRIAADDHTISGETFALNWVVNDRWFCDDNSGSQGAVCAGAPVDTQPDFKDVTVTVTWTDLDGEQSVDLQSVIKRTDPASEARVLSGAPGSNSKPDVSYTPGAAPEVLPVDLGENQYSETSNPRPDIKKATGFDPFNNTITRFETVNYLDNLDTSYETLTRQEFITVNCQCSLEVNTTSSSADDALKNGLNLGGEKVWKKYSGTVTNTAQSSYCVSCCRDHHEPPTCDVSSSEGRNECFDPWRPNDSSETTTDGYVNSGEDINHRHYNIDPETGANLGEATAGGDTTYVEACRLKRTDGLLRVVQDWRLFDIQVFPEDFLTEEANVDAYSIFIANVLKNKVTDLATPGTAEDGVPADLARPAYDSLGIAIGSTYQYLARGIYLDYMDDTTLQELNTQIRADAADNSVLQDIEFYEINMTKLANWSVEPLYDEDTDPGHMGTAYELATVRNDDIEETDTYVRGLVTAEDNSTFPAGVPQVTDVVASANFSNTGLLSWHGIDRWDADANPGENPLLVAAFDGDYTIEGTGAITVAPAITISGFIVPKRNGTTFVLTSTATGLSTTVGCTYTRNSGAYACAVAAGWGGTIEPVNGAITFMPASYTYTSEETTDAAADDLLISGKNYNR